ncbi:MAG: MBL fold metallo-hydrolase RNA specificity domain-containing protein, partial [bacterium]
MRASLSFLGAVGTVTGSRFLVRAGETRLLVDCGLFQGLKSLRLRNWEPLGVAADAIDAVVISHAHVDHTGYLPRLVREGFRGPIYGTPASLELAEILLADSAHLQEEDANFANRRGFSKHTPALPLFTVADAQAAAKLFRPLPLHQKVEIGAQVSVRLRNAGHILGSATVELALAGPEPRTVVFSGDLGRADPPLHRAPEGYPEGADTIVVESTYGDRTHPPRARALEALARVLSNTFKRGGSVLVPAFAIDRTPALLFALRELVGAGAIPDVPVFVDSPLALKGLAIYRAHRELFDADVQALIARGVDPFDPGHLRVAQTPGESRAINGCRYPCVILSASGMATGGRVLHHLAQRLPEPKDSVLLVGYQAEGTRGRALAEGAHALKIHGRYVGVRAEVHTIDGFSAHADQPEILAWLRTFGRAPDTAFVAHGEPSGSEGLARAIG